MSHRTLATLLSLALVGSLGWSAPAKKATKKNTGRPAASFDHALLKPGTLKARAPESYQAKFVTTKGDFTVKVTRAWAPLGADRFYNLVKNHFYDGTAFFRVLPGFIVQWGISPYPADAKVWTGAKIKDDPTRESNHTGRITFATGGPNTRTTQVFINFADNPRLDAMGFTPFGEVDAEGMKVLEALYSEYGEGAPRGKGPDQGRMEKEGAAYLEKDFPRLDKIKSATIVQNK
jgi:peptidyl-prolyl cis-trans isomerase A (cyclophilin A)